MIQTQGTQAARNSLGAVSDGTPGIHAIQLAWELGAEYALHLVAELTDDLRQLPIPQLSTNPEDRVQARIRDMERWAADGHQRRGTREWPGLQNGGQVTW